MSAWLRLPDGVMCASQACTRRCWSSLQNCVPGFSASSSAALWRTGPFGDVSSRVLRSISAFGYVCAMTRSQLCEELVSLSRLSRHPRCISGRALCRKPFYVPQLNGGASISAARSHHDDAAPCHTLAQRRRGLRGAAVATRYQTKTHRAADGPRARRGASRAGWYTDRSSRGRRRVDQAALR